MGSCGTVPLSKLGPDFIKIVSCERAIVEIDRRVKDMKDDFLSKSN